MKILFLAYNPTALRGILYVIEHLKKEMEFIPILVCSGCYYETDEFEVINTEKKSFNDRPLGTQKQDLSTWYNVKEKSLYCQIKSFYNTYKNMARLDAEAKRICQLVRPDIWIVTDDRVAGMHMALMKYAQKGSVIRVPSAIQHNYNESFGEREFDASLIADKGVFNYCFFQQILGGKMLHTIGEKRRAFYHTGDAFAMKVLGMLPLYPWASGASKCDYVFAASNIEKNRIVEEAYPKNMKVEVTGLIDDYEVVYGNNHIDIHEEYGDLGENVVIISIPQLAEHNLIPWELHKMNTRRICAWLFDRYGKVLISLHPKSRRDDYSFLEDEGYGYICEKRLADLMHCSDLLVCCDSSSVSEWAMLLGKRRLLMPLEKLLSEITDCNEIFVEHSNSNSIHFREKQDIKYIPTEIIKAIHYLKEKNND